MAYSTQKVFFHVPFMNETLEFYCQDPCVKLKSYPSTIDDRSWAASDDKKSRFVSDLVSCNTPSIRRKDESGESQKPGPAAQDYPQQQNGYGGPEQGQNQGGYDGQGQDQGGYDGQGQDQGGYDQGQDQGGYDQGQDQGGYGGQGQDQGGYDGPEQDGRGQGGWSG
ncbi:uncharacterized protein [Drosophila virilis]|uniref:Uncharacterized protein n=1 Tax=Drosophila virilis TaxID=7244 RepID=A0A0Q9WDS2_DROVI|nr:uncharacterized protein Dvir_GJ26347 [Drosophila virilis]